jgi:hypothetical protein
VSAKNVAVCFLLMLSWVYASFGQDAEREPTVSMLPLRDEQFAIYKAVLNSWMSREITHVNLAARTDLLDMTADESCGRKLKLEPESKLVHQFRSADLVRLGSGSDKITLVDPRRGQKDVEENDPEHTMGSLKSVDAAVDNAFAHGLFTLSEIRFDKEHKHAIVSYSFECGRLCGSGNTLILEKLDTGWRQSKQCGGWIS